MKNSLHALSATATRAARAAAAACALAFLAMNAGADALVVDAGSPVTLSTNSAYDVVLLRDTLALRGGTLSSPSIVVDGEAGCLDLNGGALSTSARLSLDPALETESEYVTVLKLRSGTTTLLCATNANADVAARIHFLAAP
ncbi:MAG: hypothetical protein IJP66_01160 [Kiritimatiellae bacterium]|nr:hypothetical protein [Kiritimatiellia bacterium]